MGNLDATRISTGQIIEHGQLFAFFHDSILEAVSTVQGHSRQE